jgi:hypothetical protein
MVHSLKLLSNRLNRPFTQQESQFAKTQGSLYNLLKTKGVFRLGSKLFGHGKKTHQTKHHAQRGYPAGE